ncbi:MAG TPA: hypothetical protein VMX16_10740 [Terriglobia bacterium]|nr:hypothetical protein [Terriglobia bacterium]
MKRAGWMHNKEGDKTMRRLLLTLGVVGLALAMGSPAFADQVYDLTVPNSQLSGYSGNTFGTVDVQWVSLTTANITFTADTGFLFTDSSAADVNVNATSFSLSNLTGTKLAGFSGPELSNGGSGQVDGFGRFNQTINEHDSFTYALETISFTLTDISGTWGDAGSVLRANSKGAFVAAHMGACGLAPDSSPCSINTSFGSNTGYVSQGGARVPEASSGALLGMLLGAGALFRRRLTT